MVIFLISNDSFSFLVVVGKILNFSKLLKGSLYFCREQVSNSFYNNLSSKSVVLIFSSLSLLESGCLGWFGLSLFRLFIDVNCQNLSSERIGSASNHSLLSFSKVPKLNESKVLSRLNKYFLDKSELTEKVNKILLRSSYFKTLDEEIVKISLPIIEILRVNLVSLDSDSLTQNVLIVQGS